MKSNSHPSLYFSPHAQKARNTDAPAKPTAQSPYLRAVLSEKTICRPGRVLSIGNSSMAAALRYINSNK